MLNRSFTGLYLYDNYLAIDMRSLPYPARAGFVLCFVTLSFAARAFGQRPDETVADREAREARRGAGVRVGVWDVKDPARVDARFSSSPLFEFYLQRGLDKQLVLENSGGVWRRITHERQQLPIGSDTVETKAFVIPLLTSLKYFPLTSPSNILEPYILGGLGLAVGIENESSNAIGGGGTSVVTGFGIRAAAGLEIHIGSSLGVTAAGRYQWMKLSEDLALENTFQGVGLEGGLSFRFNF
jgi:hypothetical protein